jgi:nucleotide-binding universal stress UspA family protein
MLCGDGDEVVLYYSPPHAGVLTRTVADPDMRVRVERYLIDAVRDEARKRLPTRLRERLEFVVGSQKPALGLLTVADQYQADLIVVGARGSGPIEELAIGSVARSVVHHATAPVLVVRPPLDGGPDRPLRVLLASDGSDSSKHAAEVLNKIDWPAGTTGTVITVVESLVTGHLPSWLEEQMLEKEAESLGMGHFEPAKEDRGLARQDLGRWAGALPAIFRDQDPLVAVGHPSQEILRTILDEDIDLVVFGARGLGPIGRLLLGSTSEHLLTHAPCSVLIVRQPEKL